MRVTPVAAKASARAVLRRLSGMRDGVETAGPQPADVVGGQGGARQGADGRADGVEPGAVRAAHQVAVQHRVVEHHGDIVGGDRDVELDRVDAEGDGAGEARQRVLGEQAACAAMSLQLKPPFHSRPLGAGLHAGQVRAE
jgi:hypothetical protein